jgi:excisionase family DNA binding protein
VSPALNQRSASADLVLVRGGFVPRSASPLPGLSSTVRRENPPALLRSAPTDEASLLAQDGRALVVVTTAQLRQLLREELRALLAEQLRPSDWLSAADVAQLLGYRRAYVSELVRRHGLPAHQPNGRNGRRMFRRTEIEAWALQRPGKL